MSSAINDRIPGREICCGLQCVDRSDNVNALKVVISLYHQTMKFPTPNRIRVVYGNQTITWECYLTETKELAEVIVMTSTLNVLADERKNE